MGDVSVVPVAVVALLERQELAGRCISFEAIGSVNRSARRAHRSSAFRGAISSLGAGRHTGVARPDRQQRQVLRRSPQPRRRSCETHNSAVSVDPGVVVGATLATALTQDPTKQVTDRPANSVRVRSLSTLVRFRPQLAQKGRSPAGAPQPGQTRFCGRVLAASVMTNI